MSRRQITYSSHPNHRARMAHAQGEKQFRTYDTSHIRPKKSKAPMVVGIVLVLVLGAALIWGISKFLGGLGGGADYSAQGSEVVVASSTTVTIPSGATAKDVASTLEASGISTADVALGRAKELGVSDSFQAGTYYFPSGYTLDQVLNAIATGDVGGVTLTIPEGYTVSQIASAVETATEGAISAQDFLDQAKASNYAASYDFLADAANDSLEGFLFPKTYVISPTATADSLIGMMLDQFKTETAGLDLTSQGLSLYEAVTMASVVEREAFPTEGSENERELVAGVFYNRMNQGMPLQSDATMMYVTGGEVTAEDLQTESPYNSYLNAGLPPTPICSPSLASLQAVASPADTDYLYFFLVENGEESYHAFSTTYEEHQAAIDTYNKTYGS